jgi:hypothetical protein
MLDPYFFQRLTRKKGVIIPDESPLPSGAEFKILGYAKAGNYTLVYWQLGEHISGQSLYRDRSPIALSGGQIALYQKPVVNTSVRSAIRSIDTDPLRLIDSRIGEFEIPQNIAIQLQNPQNIVYFCQKKTS